MKSHISIPLFRIVNAPLTGIGWVAVERWDVDFGRYVHLATFRTQELAQEFIDDELQDEEELLTTKVCDSRGLRFPAEELVEIEDCAGEPYQVCQACNKED